jgi:hypothetical protein
VSDREEGGFEGLDQLVRAHLEREAARTDASDLHARIRAGLRPTAHPRRWSRPLGWSLAAAAIVLGAFLGGRWLSPTAANAATLLRTVRAVHARGLDRCYRVHYAPDPRYWDGKKRIDGPSESVLWTRGDRFWSDCWIGDIHLAIGREEDGTLWVSPSRKKGIRFPGGDSRLPSEVAVLCDINSLTVPALMDVVLADFDVRAEGQTSRAGEATSLVWARLKPGHSHPLIATALLEIDARSGALIRLVLWTVRDGRPRGTVTFALFDSAVRDDDDYRLKSHLDPGAEVEIGSFDRAGANGPKAGK